LGEVVILKNSGKRRASEEEKNGEGELHCKTERNMEEKGPTQERIGTQEGIRSLILEESGGKKSESVGRRSDARGAHGTEGIVKVLEGWGRKHLVGGNK